MADHLEANFFFLGAALADGATFKGRVDMEMSPSSSSRTTAAELQPTVASSTSEEMQRRLN